MMLAANKNEEVWFIHLFWCFALDTFTDTAISSTRVNGEHKEKVLQRWDGGDSNGENYDLDNDAVSGSVCVVHTGKKTVSPTVI